MKWFSYSLCSMAALSVAFTSSMEAQPQSTAAPITVTNFSCTKEELKTFFPEPVVRAVLLKANISEADANSIAAELAQKNAQWGKMIREKAAKMNPNPFEDLSQRDVGLKIYRETLYEVFSQVLKAHGISDEDKIQNMLDEIRETKSKLFIECIRGARQ